jgi:hypothetical protein
VIFLALGRGLDGRQAHRGPCRGGCATHARSPRTRRVRAALQEVTVSEFPLTGTTEYSARYATARISPCSGPAGTVMLMAGLPCRTADLAR